MRGTKPGTIVQNQRRYNYMLKENVLVYIKMDMVSC
jgi:hypothetical protein